jgi:hypothetical protein
MLGFPIVRALGLRQTLHMRAAYSASIALFMVIPNSGNAQVIGRQTADGCINLSESSAHVTVEGRLTLQLFPGPPNYESIAAGDSEERTFIVELPRSACIDDDEGFANPGERFVTVHVSATGTP